MKRKLVVFVGKPGSGKSTLIQRVFPDKKAVDVFPFVIALHNGDQVTDEAAVRGYQEMYKHVAELSDDVVILELGTNHPELNVRELVALSRDTEVSIFLLDADKDVCRERVHARSLELWSDDGLERRLARDFPNTHLKLLEDSGLTYYVIDANKSIEQVEQAIISHFQ